MTAGEAGEEARQHEGGDQNGRERMTHDIDQVGRELVVGAVVGPEKGQALYQLA